VSPPAAFVAVALVAALAGAPAGAAPPDWIAAPGPLVDVPHHGSVDGFAFGGNAAVRFGHDVTAGVAKPDWITVPRVSAFATARVHPRLRLVAEAGYDRSTDDLTIERAKLDLRLGPALHAHAGVLLPPLGRSSLLYDAPRGEFTERTLVASALVGVPNSQVGLGVRGAGRRLSWELDVTRGYDDGLLLDSPAGTRLPRGRNGFHDNNGSWALAGRVALHPRAGTELGLAATAGPYNRTEVEGRTVDRTRWVGLAVVDAAGRVAGFDVAAEAAGAWVDVPPGLEGVFAQRQAGVSIEAGRTLRQPIRRSWTRSALSAGVRVESADFDLDQAGDSHTRLLTGLNFRHLAVGVVRLGAYAELRRDRFANRTNGGGLTLTTALYF
jgi:hypothetical protein